MVIVIIRGCVPETVWFPIQYANIISIHACPQRWARNLKLMSQAFNHICDEEITDRWQLVLYSPSLGFSIPWYTVSLPWHLCLWMSWVPLILENLVGIRFVWFKLGEVRGPLGQIRVLGPMKYCIRYRAFLLRVALTGQP